MPLGQPADFATSGPSRPPRTLIGTGAGGSAGQQERIVTVAHRSDVVLSTAPATAGGAASVQLAAPQAGQFFVIDRLMIATASLSAAAITFVLAAGEFNPSAPTVDFWQTVVEFSRYGGLDGAEYPAPGLIVPSGRPLTFAWLNAPPGEVCYARPQYRLCRTES